jgi:hypothetical protein
LLRLGAHLGVGGLERAAMLGGEIAHDRIRLPQREAVFLLQRRHQRIGVHREIERLLGAAERAADVDALTWQLQFADRPHRLLHVGRRVAPPHLEHLVLPFGCPYC